MNNAGPVQEDFDDLLDMGLDPGEVLQVLGRSYESTVRVLQRRGRDDLVQALRAWKEEDRRRLLEARGLAWQ